MSQESLQDALAGRYELVREIGRGGMATVWLARDLRHERSVAVKVLQSHLAATVGSTRFLREIRFAARLEHPNILAVFDSGAAGDHFWYVTPYLTEGSLRDLMRKRGPLPVDQALRLASEMSGALAYAHTLGIVHRDVKPENVLLAHGHAVLADFGIAHFSDSAGSRLTETGHVLGTPAYMSPEQASGDAVIDGRTDVYAVGAVLYEMLLGQPPFRGPSARAILALQMTETPRLPRVVRADVPADLEATVLRALAPDRMNRFASAAELERALDTQRHTKASPVARWPKRSVMLFLAMVIAIWAVATMLIRRRSPPALADEHLLAILPFASSVRDSALERLGRDLVFTLSATLDGVGDLRTVSPHTILALVPADTHQTLEQGARLARRFGAGRVVEGSLVRDGSQVRATLSLHDTESLAPVAQVTTRASSDSIARLTDSLGIGLLRRSLPTGPLPTAGLTSAFNTHSVPALRDFLEGEQHLAASRLEESIAAYGRAFDADSTFWLAAARMSYALSWALREADPSLQRSIAANRGLLMPRDRMDVDAATVLVDSNVTTAMALLTRAVQQDPTSWFRWLALGDGIFHFGPLRGIPLIEAKTAMDRALLLNPRFLPGADHAMLLALLFRDGAGIAQGLATFDGPGKNVASEYGTLRIRFHFLAALLRGDSARATILADSVVLDKVGPTRVAGTFFEPLLFGWPAWQVRLEQAVLRHPLDPRQAYQHRIWLAHSWAARGAWDSAIAIHPPNAGDRYRLAVLGMMAGALGAERAAAYGAVAREKPLLAPPVVWEAERAWLDGLVAAAREDDAEFVRALSLLQRNPSIAGRTAFELLRAMEPARRGRVAGAAESLAALDRRLSEGGQKSTVDMASVLPLERIQLARWLASLGQLERADSALRWIESPFFTHGSLPYNALIAPYVWLERARLAEQRGDLDLAQRGYARFVSEVDIPNEQLQPVRAEAAAKLAQLRSRN